MTRVRFGEKLAWLGVFFDPAANQATKTIISQPGSKVGLYIVPTDEELMIARQTLSLLAARSKHANSTAASSAFV